MNKNVGKQYEYIDSSLSGDYHFIFDKSVLGRTDWYAYTGDMYGTTVDASFLTRDSVSDHFDALSGSYCPVNEVMFRKSLSLDSLREIRCDRAIQRQELIDTLTNIGITEINGKKLDTFIKVRSKL